MWWAISCLQRDTASVATVARRLGVDWHTLWDAIKPLSTELAEDPGRLVGVQVLGVDEHIWHHAPRPGKGPERVDRDGRPDQAARRNGRVRTRARLLDLVPGRSGPAYAGWLNSRGPAFTSGVQIATLDPFRGYGNAIRDGALRVLDSFHTCPIPEIARLGRTLRSWREQFLAYFTTGRANDGGTEAVNGIIELNFNSSIRADRQFVIRGDSNQV